MYGYNNYAPLDIEEILKRATEEEVFNIVIQEAIIRDKGAMYIAPYRNDNNPNCYFEEYNGKLTFVDFASSYTHKSMDCINFISACFNVSYAGALEVINEKLSLGLGDSLGKIKKTTYEHGYVEEKSSKDVFEKRTITYLPRNFSHKDKQFWIKYKITREQLIEDGVIPVDIYRFKAKSRKTITVRPLDICYAYTKFVDINGNPLEGKVKIYRPYAHKEAKWTTNCSQNDIGGLENLPLKGKLLLVAKSYKDYRVLKNMGTKVVVWFQNEGMMPKDKILLELTKRFDLICVWFDNDSTGITNSKVVSNYINKISESEKATPLFLPPILLTHKIKDPSDYLKVKGEDALLKFMVAHNLLD